MFYMLVFELFMYFKKLKTNFNFKGLNLYLTKVLT